ATRHHRCLPRREPFAPREALAAGGNCRRDLPDSLPSRPPVGSRLRCVAILSGQDRLNQPAFGSGTSASVTLAAVTVARSNQMLRPLRRVRLAIVWEAV